MEIGETQTLEAHILVNPQIPMETQEAHILVNTQIPLEIGEIRV